MVIITRDRPLDLEVCLGAVLTSTFRNFELVVVDQSVGNVSAELVQSRAVADQRVRLVRYTGKGAARSRNIGVTATNGEIIVLTDDDCEPEPGWLDAIVGALQADLTAGIAFGAVLPAPRDPRDGLSWALLRSVGPA